MSKGRNHSFKHALPANPAWIELENSDGDSNLWPQNTLRVVDSEGQVNFMRPVDVDDPLCVKWRLEVGAALAALRGLDEGPVYALKTWPSGYRMFDHNKGPDHNPRHDAYLIGSTTVNRFRSVPEFIPHAIWLNSDPTLSRGNCRCKYCTKTPQREISRAMGLTSIGGDSQSPGPSRAPKARREGKERTKPTRVPKPYASVQRVPKPVRPPTILKQVMSAARDKDVRDMVSNTSMKFRRVFREGEVVWCALNPLIRGPRQNGDDIKFWPAVVMEIILKTQPESQPFTEGEPSTATRPIANGDEGGDYEDEDKPLWNVRQWNVYKLKLLGCDASALFVDGDILPYQSCGPSSSLIESTQEVLWSADYQDREEVCKFSPCPVRTEQGDVDRVEPLFADAAYPFALAIQIASRITSLWSLTDEWEFKFAQPQLQLTRPSKPPASFHTAVEVAASENVASQITGVPGTEETYPTRSRTAPSQPSTTQTRYQGLWWGAERIWADDLIRLKVSRRQFAPEGTESIVPPAGLALGAGCRGLFMKVEGLFSVDVLREDGLGIGKEARASGLLYELADEDLVDGPTTLQQTIDPQLLTNGDAQQHHAGPSESGNVSTLSSTNTLLSHPGSSDHYPLPPAPLGFKFRPIVIPGKEAVISLSLISGRYYPRLLQHPLLQEFVDDALQNIAENGGLDGGNHLWALEGLSPGFYNAVDPTFPKSGRKKMLKDADLDARKDVAKAREDYAMRKWDINQEEKPVVEANGIASHHGDTFGYPEPISEVLQARVIEGRLSPTPQPDPDSGLNTFELAHQNEMMVD